MEADLDIVQAVAAIDRVHSRQSESQSQSMFAGKFDPYLLHLGQEVDALDCGDVWRMARVIRITEKKVLINFKGWGDKWDEWYPIGSSSIVKYRTKTRAKEYTGPQSGKQHEFYKMSGDNLEKFLDYLNDHWNPFYARFDAAAPSDDLEKRHAFDVTSILPSEDLSLLVGHNHEFLVNALSSYVENPWKVDIIYEYLKQNLRVLYYIIAARKLGEANDVLMVDLLRLLDGWCMGSLPTVLTVEKLIDSDFPQPAVPIKPNVPLPPVLSEHIKICRTVQEHARGLFFQKHGVGPVETADDPVRGPVTVVTVVDPSGALPHQPCDDGFPLNHAASLPCSDAPISAGSSPSEPKLNSACLISIFSFLSLESLHSAAQTCKTWRMDHSSRMILANLRSRVLPFAVRPPPKVPKNSKYRHTYDFSMYSIELVNCFGRLGGFTMVKERLSEMTTRVGECSFHEMTAYLKLLVGCVRFLTEERRLTLLEGLRLDEIFLLRIKTLTNEELVRIPKESIHSAIVYARLLVGWCSRGHLSTFASTSSSSSKPAVPSAVCSSTDAHLHRGDNVPSRSCITLRDWTIHVAMSFYLRMFQCVAPERRGIREMGELVSHILAVEDKVIQEQRKALDATAILKVIGATEKLAGLPHATLQSPSPPSSAFLVDWLRHHDMISHILALTAAGDERVLRLSSPILVFMQRHGALTFEVEVATIIESLRTGVVTRAGYIVLEALVPEMSADEIYALSTELCGFLYTSSKSMYIYASSTALPNNPKLDEYFNFLTEVTIAAVKRMTKLAESQQTVNHRETIDTFLQQNAAYLSNQPHDPRQVEKSVFGVRCFMDLIRSSMSKSEATTSGDSASSIEPDTSNRLTCPISIEQQTSTIMTRLPDCLNSFPEKTITAGDGLYIPSKIDVVTLTIIECIDQLSSSPYNPSTCLSYMKLIKSVRDALDMYTDESGRYWRTNSTSIEKGVLAWKSVMATINERYNLLTLLTTLIKRQYAYSLHLTESDVQLGSGQLGSTVIKTYLDCFNLLLEGNPQQELWTEEILESLWELLVGPNDGVQPNPVIHLDAPNFYWFLHRLVDADLQQYKTWYDKQEKHNKTMRKKLSAKSPDNKSHPLENSSHPDESSDLRVADWSIMNDGTVVMKGDDIELCQFRASNESSSICGKLLPLLNTSRKELEARPKRTVLHEKLQSATIHGTHFAPLMVNYLLVNVLLKFPIFSSAPVKLSTVLSARSSSTTAPSAIFGHPDDSIQLVLVMKMFFLANEYVGNVTPLATAPFFRLDRHDGDLIGMDELWEIVTGGNGNCSATLNSKADLFSLGYEHSCQIRQFLIELYQRKYLGVGYQNETLRKVQIAFMNTAMEKIQLAVNQLEENPNGEPSAVAGASTHLFLLLVVLEEYLEHDLKSIAALTGSSSSSKSGVSSSCAAAIFAESHLQTIQTLQFNHHKFLMASYASTSSSSEEVAIGELDVPQQNMAIIAVMKNIVALSKTTVATKSHPARPEKTKK